MKRKEQISVFDVFKIGVGPSGSPIRALGVPGPPTHRIWRWYVGHGLVLQKGACK
jgi:hypothetical protein